MAAPRPTPSEARQLAESYRARLPHQAGSYRVLTDKMPSNLWLLGCITQMFPNAAIIHCRRDPRDVALSNFSQLYDLGNNFAFDLDHLAHYIACYEAMMAHWQKILPERLMTVEYESMVADAESQIRALVQLTGLSWHPDCLHPHRSRRSVSTASNWQVRQKIYSRSVGRWKHYESHLRDFQSRLLHYRRQQTMGADSS